ncbi:MAG: SpoIIE family protein phosphatase [Terracidiphilus sp.]
MLPRCARVLLGLLSVAVLAVPALSQSPAQPALVEVHDLGKGTAVLGGPWQFHTGDDPAWAVPQTVDATGTNGWEQLSVDKPWGAQGHPSYTGYGWYRKHISFTPAPGGSQDFYLLIRHVGDAYQVYWNGRMVGHNGGMPPKPLYFYTQAPQIVNLGPARDGVLAVRVWKAPLASFDSERIGGFYSAPIAGSPDDIRALKASIDYEWLRSNQYYFALRSLYALVMILSLLAWYRDRSRQVLLAMAVFAASPTISVFLVGLHLPLPFSVAIGFLQPALALQDIGLWFLLIYLLELDRQRNLVALTYELTVINITVASLDGFLTFFDWSRPFFVHWAQVADGSLTAVQTMTQMLPFLLLAYAVRNRLDFARWAVAISAFLTEMLFAIRIASEQGSRYTHWTLSEKMLQPLFTLGGNPFTVQEIAQTLLLFAIIYAMFGTMQDTLHRQGSMEQELRSARELQHVLIPKQLPELPGFAVTSAYRPAQEVGGDFFQIIPLEGVDTGSTLIVLGDVSGKGLKAAMAVSFIVGTVCTAAKFTSSPGEFLVELNQRLFGRLDGGFTTCVVLRIDSDGHCAVASAGHPAPFMNRNELEMEGTLPLGVLADVAYPETHLDLREGDHLVMYTDGLLEARNAKGEIFSFERVRALFSTRPGAAAASGVAMQFGQEDDITVVTVTRLGAGVKPTTRLIAPEMANA